MKNYVITIERGFGSGGKTIGCEVAKRLRIPCYSDEIIQMASEESGLNPELFERLQQKNRNGSVSKNLATIEKAIIVSPGLSATKAIKDENLYNYQAKIIRRMAMKESCVILGYCANYILKTFPNVLAVNIQAPYHICHGEIMDRYVLDSDEAASLIAEKDIQRSSYYKYFTGKDWTNYKEYDVVMNSYRLGREKCVDQIIQLLRIKLGDKAEITDMKDMK